MYTVRYREFFYSIKYLTIDELIEKKQVEFQSTTKCKTVFYGKDGFGSPHSPYNFLPYHHTKNPPKNFEVDFILHSKRGGFSFQDHLSVKITTPNGEIYSIGFYGDMENGLSIGEYETPDKFIFLPNHAYAKHKQSYTLPDSKSFHVLLNWIEEIVSSKDNFYHFTDRNCAFFGDRVKKKVLELGAKPCLDSNKKYTTINKISFFAKKFFFCIFAKNPLIKYLFKLNKGIYYQGNENYNITHVTDKKFMLPEEVLLY